MIIVNVCVSVCILLGVQVQGHGGTDHNLKADTANASGLTSKFIHTTYNGHTSAVSALTFGFLSPWPKPNTCFRSRQDQPVFDKSSTKPINYIYILRTYVPYRPSDLE